MPTLRLVRADEPIEVCENEDLRRMLARLTWGTYDKAQGSWVLLLSEAQALYEVLAPRTFSQGQLEAVVRTLRLVDPYASDTRWNEARLTSLVLAASGFVERGWWIDEAVRRLHAAMRAQGPHARFRLALCRAALVTFLTIDHLPSQPEELLRLAG